jgi:glycosyltransferase domain-containing protein
MDLSNITIIIPTYNRSAYLHRNLTFWKDSKIQMIVADGSSLSQPAEKLSEFSNLAYFYEETSLQARLKRAIDHVVTDFAIICGDDELMLPSALSMMRAFLIENEDFTACIGRCIAVTKRECGRQSVAFLEPDKVGQVHHQVNQNSSSDRVNYHFSNYAVSTFYGLHRRKSLQAISKFSFRPEIESVFVTENLFELASAVVGKSAVLDFPSWLRSSENKPIRRKNKDISIHEWMPENKIFYENIVSQLTNDILRIDPSRYLKEQSLQGVILNAPLLIKFSSSTPTQRIKIFIVNLEKKLFYTFIWKIWLTLFRILVAVLNNRVPRTKLAVFFGRSYFLNSSRLSFQRLEMSEISIENCKDLVPTLNFLLSYQIRSGANH